MTTPIKAPPFGRDVSCRQRMRHGVMVSGFVLVGEAAIRRLSTERGTLLYDPNYGLLLIDLMNKPMTVAEQAAIPGRIAAELEKDTRVERAVVTVTPVERGYDIDILLVTIDGTGSLALHVDDVSLSVLSIREETAT